MTDWRDYLEIGAKKKLLITTVKPSPIDLGDFHVIRDPLPLSAARLKQALEAQLG